MTRNVETGQFVSINGLDQWLVMRGEDYSNPVLLVLSGPGVALSAIVPFFAEWEESFTLVHWDQPGSGATYGRNPQGQGELSIARLVSDGLAVVNHIQQSLNVEKVAVLGISAGSIVGLHMVTESPEMFSAYVGTGQFVNWAKQDAQGYQLLLDQQRDLGNAEAVEELLTLGPPPYEDLESDVIKSKYISALTAEEMAEFPVFSGLMTEALTNPPENASYIPSGVSLGDPRQLATNAYQIMREQYLGFDAAGLSLEFSMPMFFIQGAEDFYSVTSVVQEYEAAITAPLKRTLVIENGSHSVFWLRSKFLQALRQYVLPAL